MLRLLPVIIAIALLLSGCLSQAAQDSYYYQREFVGGNPQHRGFDFSGISGPYQELVTVQSSELLLITASLTQGSLKGDILGPNGEVLASFSLAGDVVWLETIPGPLNHGTYILRFHAQQARGKIILQFKHK